jgi:hypothetical protein
MKRHWRKLVILALFPACATFAQEPPPAETPAAVAIRIRRADAEKRALFQSAEPLVLTLEANFGIVTRDRDQESTKQYPGVLRTADASGRAVAIPVQLSARGHLRRSRCDFLPLRVTFSKPETKGTPFEMRGAGLKLVTHCSGGREYEQYILREYLAYRIHHIITPYSFRARLAKITYVDSTKGKPITTRYAIFLEDDDDVARRLGGQVDERKNLMFSQLHPVALSQMTIFEYMIANTDYSIMAQHNVRLVGTDVGLTYPIAYDFDISGLVNAPYGIHDPRLRLKALTDRLYRGPCLSADRMAVMLNTFRNKKLEVFAALAAVPDMTDVTRSEVKRFLNEFFDLIDRPGAVKLNLVQTCLKGGN